MIFNTPGDFSEIMYHKGDYYSNGTEVVLTDEYINTHMFDGKKIWKYARFNDKVIRHGQTAYFFYAIKNRCLDYYRMGMDYSEINDYAPYFVIYAFDIESAIQEFTKPIKLSEEQKDAWHQAIIDSIDHPKRDWDYPELLFGWIVYIAAMVGSLMFKDFYILWLVVTYIFYRYRKGIVNQ